jgi:hypothetical protein
MDNHLKTENIELILFTLKRPSLFSIQKVEDFFIFFNGYVIAKNDPVVSDFLDDFHQFVKNNYAERSIKGYDCKKIIRLHSANDLHSLELLSLWINEFIKQTVKIS